MVSSAKIQIADSRTQALCIVCGAGSMHRFTKTLREKEVAYLQCLACGHLTASEFVSDQTYGQGSYFQEVDTGWQERNVRILFFLKLLARLPGIHFGPESIVLDYGCGVGKLVDDLNQNGFIAYGFEPHTQDPARSDRVFADWTTLSQTVPHADLVTCIEVLEHLRRPDDVLSVIVSLLPANGYLLVSTEVFRPLFHHEDWYYLNPEAGHVSIFTEKSLRMLLERHQFRPILRINGHSWLFRRIARRGINGVEQAYFLASQMRIRLGIRINYGLQI